VIKYLLSRAVIIGYGRRVARSRLKPPQRREQLLDIGAAMFAEKPYEDVFVEEIAARAGVSRALLYHYYPSKRDLYVAIFKRASIRLLARANLDSELPLAEQLASGLKAHIQYFADHPFEAIAVNRGALSDDPAVQAIVTEELNVVGKRLIKKLVAEGRPRDVTEIAVEGWLAFVRAACVKWVQLQNISRAELTEMCLRVFECAVGYPGDTGQLGGRLSLASSPGSRGPNATGTRVRINARRRLPAGHWPRRFQLTPIALRVNVYLPLVDAVSHRSQRRNLRRWRLWAHPVD
jgi:AcrR family transcriptional regulator